jgi:omptin
MRHLFLVSLAMAAAGTANAGEVKMQSLDGLVTFSGSFGLTSVRANEYVYDGKAKVSQLIWKSDHINTFNAALSIDLPKDWYLDAHGALGFDGDGYMADFDWLKPGKPWSDRSISPDTRLDHYFAGSIELGRTLVSRDGTDIGLGAGFKYTDIKWSAWGGSYIYSIKGFRDARGEFDPDEKGISYRQAWPVPYLGVNLSHREGSWSVNGSLQGGLAVNSYDIDDHWVRKLRFYDYFDATPTLSVAGSLDYTVWNNAALYLGGSFDRMFRVRGDTKAVRTKNGKEVWFYDGAGGDYRAATVSFGLKGRF